MPQGCLDLYVCSFPCCGPHANYPQGLLRRADYPNAKLCLFPLESIMHMQPALFLYENVPAITHGEGHGDLGVIMAYFRDQVQNYRVSVVNGVDPMQFGFPPTKNRLLILGIRADQGSGLVLEQNLAALIGEP